MAILSVITLVLLFAPSDRIGHLRLVTCGIVSYRWFVRLLVGVGAY